MSKSAKVHKRVPKKLKSSAPSASTVTTTAPNHLGKNAQSHVQAAKKKAKLKERAKSRAHVAKDGEGVLGGADYVNLMMAGRRKAREEAAKLPRENS